VHGRPESTTALPPREFKITCQYNDELEYYDLVVWERVWHPTHPNPWERVVTGGGPAERWRNHSRAVLRQVIKTAFH
jgi:hypothetical protein